MTSPPTPIGPEQVHGDARVADTRSAPGSSRLGNRLVLLALATSPLMYLVELVGPDWIIYVLRAGWVLLVAVAVVLVVRAHRSVRFRR